MRLTQKAKTDKMYATYVSYYTKLKESGRAMNKMLSKVKFMEQRRVMAEAIRECGADPAHYNLAAEVARANAVVTKSEAASIASMLRAMKQKVTAHDIMYMKPNTLTIAK